MKGEKIKKGDLVMVTSAVNGNVLDEFGVGLVIEMSYTIPFGPGYNSPKETCTLLWRGIVEKNIDLEWIMKLPSFAHESVLACGEIESG